MQIITDLQIHSKFSRAVSPQMTLPNIAAWARKKGIGLVATGDWTHPLWMREIERDLEELGNGLLQLNKDLSLRAERSPAGGAASSRPGGTPRNDTVFHSPLFLLATEVSCIYSQGGKGRRVHTLIWVPSLDSAHKINKEMTRQGCNLLSDGRPIIGLTSIQVAELVFSIEPQALIIPAHAWTPWFSLYGSMSGFNSITDAFGKYADRIYAVETGLSSNPAMNWQIKELDNRAIVSFSDAHSGPKLGREATVFELQELSYDEIYKAIISSARGDENLLDPLLAGSPQALISTPKSSPSSVLVSELGKRSAQILPPLAQSESRINSLNHEPKIAYTIEFFPEEGKYHYTGHRACNIRLSPGETKTKGTACPVCGKPLTQGVMQRVEELAGRSEVDLKLRTTNYEPRTGNVSLPMTYSETFPHRPPFVMLVPLQEIISECIGSPVTSRKVIELYDKLTTAFAGEFNVLLHTNHADIASIAGERIATGIDKVRSGDIHIDPGYDGVFGVVKIWVEGEQKPLVDATKEQLSLL